MSFRTAWWTLLTAMALAAILLLNYWASYQPLSTLTYSGIVLSLCGLANLVRKDSAGRALCLPRSTGGCGGRGLSGTLLA